MALLKAVACTCALIGVYTIAAHCFFSEDMLTHVAGMTATAALILALKEHFDAD